MVESVKRARSRNRELEVLTCREIDHLDGDDLFHRIPVQRHIDPGPEPVRQLAPGRFAEELIDDCHVPHRTAKAAWVPFQ